MTFEELVKKIMNHKPGWDREVIWSDFSGISKVNKVKVWSSTGIEITLTREGLIALTDDGGAYMEVARYATPEEMYQFASICKGEE